MRKPFNGGVGVKRRSHTYRWIYEDSRMKSENSASRCKVRSRITFLQPSYAPYRHALFRQLTSIADVKVIYTAGIVDPNRAWSAQIDGSYHSEESRYVTIRILGRSFKFSLSASLQASKDTDAVVTCTNILEFPTYILSALIAKIRKKPILCLLTVGEEYKFIRDERFYARFINFIAMRIIYSIVKLSDFCICYSKSSGRIAYRLKKQFLSSSQYYPLEEEYGNSYSNEIVTAAQYFTSTQVETAGSKTLKACILGYVSPRKGLVELLSMVERLDLMEEIEIVVAGPIESDNEYGKALVRQFGKSVKFIGRVSSQEKICLLQETDILIFPTLHDSWGYVVNEAMYFGVPVIASNHSEAAKDLIQHDVNGWTYDDDREFLSAIEAARNAELLSKFSAAASRDVRLFNQQCLSNWKKAIGFISRNKDDRDGL